MPEPEQAQVRDWLHRMDGERLLTLPIPRLRRVGLRVAMETSVEGRR
jgi:CelD/BcsL family acetyltransferase involved in cellulose biosynthesis